MGWSRVARHVRNVVIGIGLLIAGLPLAYLGWPARQPLEVPSAQRPVDGRFELVDSLGRTVTDESFRGRWLLVFFGFTYCPDVCPTTLVDVSAVLERLGEDADQVQPLFITVDPQRDTPDVLARYTAFFDPRITGLTGTEAQVTQAMKAYGVRAERVPIEDSYLVDHSTRLYLMSPNGDFVTAYSPADGRGAIAASIEARLHER
ncbi:SCO family protein [Pseudomonas sp. Marseille-QA0892]